MPSDITPLLERLGLRDPKLDPAADLSLDELYDLLASQRRRWLIDHLADADEPLTKRDLAELLAFVESEGIDYPGDLSEAAIKRAYVSLHQTHLPELDAAGVVERDEAGVRLTPRGEHLARIIREVRRMNGGDA